MSSSARSAAPEADVAWWHFAGGASLNGGLIGAWEAAALVRWDTEVTLSRGGAALLALGAFALNGVLFGVGAAAFALLRRTRLGRKMLGARTNSAVFSVALALLFYGGFYLNERLLPGKTHPLSLAADLALLAAAWALVRFAPRVRAALAVRAAGYTLLAAAALVVGITGAASGQRLPRPDVAPPPGALNLLLITMDTTRADRLGAYGGPPGLTPNLDRLAAQGFAAARAYCPMPLTGPSHAALLTGRTPRESGVAQNGVPLPAAATTMAEVLRGRGYRTAAVVGAFPVCSKLGFAQGFEYFDDDFSPGHALSRLTAGRLAGALRLVDAKAELQRPAGEVTRRAAAWLTAERRGPWFLWVHYFDPHTPYAPPAAYRERSRAAAPQVRLYDGEVAYMDAAIGDLLATLERAELAQNTVVVAVADHGEALGEHGYFYDHGRDVYEPSMRVPLIIKAPPGFAGLGVEYVMEAPATATAPPADVVSTTTLFDFLLKGLAAYPPRVPPVSNEVWPLRSDAAWGEAWEEGVDRRMLVTAVGPKTYKFIRNPGGAGGELYDLDRDAAETENLAAAEPAVAAALRARLDAYFARQPALAASPAMDERTKEKLRSLGYM